MHERSGHQRASGQAEHVLRVTGQQAKTEQGSKPHAADTSDQRADQNRY